MNSTVKEETEYERADRKEAEALVEAFSRYVNQGRRTRYIVEALLREHRTLQQSMTGAMLAWIVYLASLKEGWNWDLRNEAAVKIAKQIVEKVPDVKYGLPLI
jgi:hypothetical protein